jgi:hypothetical protein
VGAHVRTLAEGGELGAVGVPGQGRDLVPVIGQHHALARRLDVPAPMVVRNLWEIITEGLEECGGWWLAGGEL